MMFSIVETILHKHECCVSDDGTLLQY